MQKKKIMAKTEAITMDGEVMQALGYENFRVELDNNVQILASVCGKMRLHHIRIMPGDRVRVEMSPYDLTRGRICYRYRNVTSNQ